MDNAGTLALISKWLVIGLFLPMLPVIVHLIYLTGTDANYSALSLAVSSGLLGILVVIQSGTFLSYSYHSPGFASRRLNWMSIDVAVFFILIIVFTFSVALPQNWIFHYAGLALTVPVFIASFAAFYVIPGNGAAKG